MGELTQLVTRGVDPGTEWTTGELTQLVTRGS